MAGCRAMAMKFAALYVLLIPSLINQAVAIPVNFCFNKMTSPIPSDHLFWTKPRPLIIGHRGQPRVFQENTLEGIQSLVQLGADGFEIDIYLTKDKQLVLFHDDNTEKLTGEKHWIWDLTVDQLKNLTLKTTLQYGKNTYNFPKGLKIPTLKEVLVAMKKTDLFMYLEMKPSHNPRWDNKDSIRSIETGQAVAKLVTKLGLEKRAFLVSFDPVKPWAAKQENPDLVVGTFFEKYDWMKNATMYQKLKKQYQNLLPNLSCLDKLPNSSKLTDFLFESGSVFKAMNASFVDMDYKIYDNPKYSNDTFNTFRKNYNPKISAGGWTFYNMKMSPEELDESEDTIQSLVSQGIERLITDDVPRMRKKLKRTSGAERTVVWHRSFSFVVISWYLFRLA